MTSLVAEMQAELRQLANDEIAEHSQRFFKTGVGEYGYGDKFLGIRVPEIRKIARKFLDLKYSEITLLLESEFHEERLAALVVLTLKADRAKLKSEQKSIFDFYIRQFEHVNNWDLVDISCPRIVGRYLMDHDKSCLYQWATSDHLWTRRIAIITTLWFVRNGRLDDAFKLSELLLDDAHDLIHKAVGWVLRECGKKDEKRLEAFLKLHYKVMPRTMLRYALEKFPAARRKQYLNGEI